MAEIIRKVALLSTGDEITNGDILNTNGYAIAQQLFEHNIQPGLHLTASDDQTEIETAMQFLLRDHAALIITGGLGPTSDDRTRFALSHVLKAELIFDETCWQRVVERLQRLSLAIPETNRQQCLFPRDAIIFANDNGTAAACQIIHGQQSIFMLPGPPFECLPIFTQKVLPYLQANGYARPLFRCEWLLLGVSEGSIAALLDPLMENSGCYIGYRVNQPYLEVKLQSADKTALEKMRSQIAALISAQSISTRKEKASAQLIQWLLEKQCILTIDDQATGGLLATTLLNPATHPYLRFGPLTDPAAIQITLSGLEPYWHNRPEQNFLQVSIHTNQHEHHATLSIPFRKERTPLFAMEMACWQIVQECK